jgi:hypothetical protein
MRGAMVALVLIVLSAQACSATQPIIPVATMTIDPTNVQVTSQPNQTVSVNFNGTVTVDKLPMARTTVTLSPAVDAGWPVAVSPSTLVFTSESPQTFSCTVSVPGNTSGQSTNLVIDAKCVGNGFQSLSTATAIITVKGSGPANQTKGTGGTGSAGTNQTIPGGGPSAGSGAFRLGPLDMTGLAVVIAVVAAMAASGVFWVRRRRTAGRLS